MIYHSSEQLYFDIMFFGSTLKNNKFDGWWPTLEEYNPELTKEDWKERYEILKKYQAFLKAQRERK